MSGWANVTISGWEETVNLLKLTGETARAWGRTKAYIQSREPYAHFIEKVFYLHGRPGRRRAGPARMMAIGARRIRQLLPQAIARNVTKGPTVLRHAVSGVLVEGTRVTKAHTPVRSGRLRESMYSVTR